MRSLSFLQLPGAGEYYFFSDPTIIFKQTIEIPIWVRKIPPSGVRYCCIVPGGWLEIVLLREWSSYLYHYIGENVHCTFESLTHIVERRFFLDINGNNRRME